MKVKITNCHDPDYWYYTRVGEIFDVNESDEFNYVTSTNIPMCDCLGYILKSDCVKVKVEVEVEGKSPFLSFEENFALISELLRRKKSIKDYNGCAVCKNCGNLCHPNKTRFEQIVKIWGYYLCMKCLEDLEILQKELDEAKKKA